MIRSKLIAFAAVASVVLARRDFAAEPPDQWFNEKFSIDVPAPKSSRKQFPQHETLSATAHVSVRGIHIDEQNGEFPQRIQFTIRGGVLSDEVLSSNSLKNPDYEIYYNAAAGKVFPTPAGLYRAEKNPHSWGIVCNRVTDEALVKRAGMSPRSYYILSSGSTSLFGEYFTLHEIEKDVNSTKTRARMLVNPTAELLLQSKFPPDRELWVVEGELVALPADDRYGGVPSVHRVLNIVPPEDSPTGLIGWVELDAMPEKSSNK